MLTVPSSLMSIWAPVRFRDAADDLAARADQGADPFGVDLDRVDLGGMLAHLNARGGQHLLHDVQNLHAGGATRFCAIACRMPARSRPAILRSSWKR